MEGESYEYGAWDEETYQIEKAQGKVPIEIICVNGSGIPVRCNQLSQSKDGITVTRRHYDVEVFQPGKGKEWYGFYAVASRRFRMSVFPKGDVVVLWVQTNEEDPVPCTRLSHSPDTRFDEVSLGVVKKFVEARYKLTHKDPVPKGAANALASVP